MLKNSKTSPSPVVCSPSENESVGAAPRRRATAHARPSCNSPRVLPRSRSALFTRTTYRLCAGAMGHDCDAFCAAVARNLPRAALQCVLSSEIAHRSLIGSESTPSGKPCQLFRDRRRPQGVHGDNRAALCVASLKARPMKVNPIGSPRVIAVGTVIVGVPVAATGTVDSAGRTLPRGPRRPAS